MAEGQAFRHCFLEEDMEQEKLDLHKLAHLFDSEAIDQAKIQDAVSQILQAVGENPNRQGLINTPGRVSRMYLELLEGYRVDPVALVNDACFFAGKPLVSAAILRFDGQLATFRRGGPCYRCLFPAPPPPGQIPSCAEAGVLGAVAGVLGALQATEVVKEILGMGTSMAGALLIYDALATTFRRITIRSDPGCPLCGKTPTVRDLSGHGDNNHACAAD